MPEPFDSWSCRRTCAKLRPYMTRLSRRIAACLAAAALAFAQLAVSAYACPSRHHDEATPPHDVASEHCAKVATTNLCERHCDYGASSLQSAPHAAIVPDLPPPLVRFGVLRI